LAESRFFVPPSHTLPPLAYQQLPAERENTGAWEVVERENSRWKGKISHENTESKMWKPGGGSAAVSGYAVDRCDDNR